MKITDKCILPEGSNKKLAVKSLTSTCTVW
jgi:hypothetical protein